MSKEKKRKVVEKDKEGLVYFEIWGMLLIIVSFILLSELGAIGSTLNRFIRLLFGDFYWLTLIFVIYYGVIMIIRHKFITYSSLRIKGIIFFSIGLLMFSHLPIYNALKGELNDSNSNLITLTYNLYLGYLKNNRMDATFGGGIIGAGALTITLMLIGELGSIVVAGLFFVAGLAVLFEKTVYDFIKDFFVGTKDVSKKTTGWVTNMFGRMHTISKEKKDTKDVITPEKIPTTTSSEEKAKPFVHIRQENIPYPRPAKYTPPNLSLLTYYDNDQVLERQKDITLQQARHIRQFLKENFTNLDIDEIYIGPSISTYILPIKSSALKNALEKHLPSLMELLGDDRIRFVYEYLDRQQARIEIPNEYVYLISLKEILDERYRHGLILGRDYRGEFFKLPFASAFNVLTIGNDINSKIEFLKLMVLELIYTYTPDEIEIALFDSTRFELNEFAEIPHLFNDLFIDRVGHAKKQLHNLYTKLEYRMNGHDRDMKPIVVIMNDLTDFFNIEEDYQRMIIELLQYGPQTKIYTIAATINLEENLLTPQFRSLFETTIAFRINNPQLSQQFFDIETDLLLKNGDCIINDRTTRRFIRVQCAQLKEDDYLF